VSKHKSIFLIEITIKNQCKYHISGVNMKTMWNLKKIHPFWINRYFPLCFLKSDVFVHTLFTKENIWFTYYLRWWNRFCDSMSPSLDVIVVWSRCNFILLKKKFSPLLVPWPWGSRDEEGGEFFHSPWFTDSFWSSWWFGIVLSQH